MLHKTKFAAGVCALVAVLGVSTPSARAVIVLGSSQANPGTNTGVPVDSNGNPYTAVSPSNGLSYDLNQFEGSFGTPISSTVFLSAEHLNSNAIVGVTSATFTFDNGTNTATSYNVVYLGYQGDVDAWGIVPTVTYPTATFAIWAPVDITANDAAIQNQNLVVLGNGTTRGTAITGGWDWGSSQTTESWGTNTVNQVVAGNVADGDSKDYIYFQFQKTVDGMGNITDPNEAILSAGDSGGGVFVFDPTTQAYELDGVNSGVQEASATPDGTQLQAALYDSTGYYIGNTPVTGPLGSYASDLYDTSNFIETVVPEPATSSLVLVALMTLGGVCYRRRKYT